jgi:nucleotide-binding universal stress UspA family protein
MLKHILVPLDGSALSEEALEYGLKIVGPQGKITLVSAVDLPDVTEGNLYPIVGASLGPIEVGKYSDVYPRAEDWVVQAREYLEAAAGRIREAMPEVLVENLIEIGDPASFILKSATRLEVDAIVMSTHGRSGLSRWIFGSVTTRVLNHAPCPVFVVPSKERRKELKAAASELYYG